MPLPMPDKSRFSPKEVAEIFGFSTPTVYRWIEEGQLKAYRIAGRAIRILREDVLKLIQEIEPDE